MSRGLYRREDRGFFRLLASCAGLLTAGDGIPLCLKSPKDEETRSCGCARSWLNFVGVKKKRKKQSRGAGRGAGAPVVAHFPSQNEGSPLLQVWVRDSHRSNQTSGRRRSSIRRGGGFERRPGVPQEKPWPSFSRRRGEPGLMEMGSYEDRVSNDGGGEQQQLSHRLHAKNLHPRGPRSPRLATHIQCLCT
jgi:hypothetical protein